MLSISQDDIPKVCSKCLGKTHSRLVRDSTGEECRICHKPFVTYQWKLNKRSRSTIICKPCAENEEACQSCIKDIKYHLDLHLRTAALRIMREEGGADSNKDAVLEAISEHFNSRTDEQSKNSSLLTLQALVSRFPLPEGHSEGHRTLCVYGIEEDLSIDALRSYLKASIDKIEWVPLGRYAFLTFSPTSDLPQTPKSAIIDGRRLLFAWGERINVPKTLHKAVGASVRKYLQQYK